MCSLEDKESLHFDSFNFCISSLTLKLDMISISCRNLLTK